MSASVAAARWTRAANTSRRSTSPRGATSRCAAGSPRTPAFRCSSTTTPRRSRSAKAGSARPRACATTSAWSCRPGSAAASCCDGRLLDGRNGNAGHIGHVIVEPDGLECVCGARGCLEAEASGTAIARITGGRRPRHPPTSSRGPARSSAARLRASRTCSISHLAVVAGSVALGYGEPFFAAAQAEIDAVLPDSTSRCGTRIVPGALGPDGPLIGAAAVALTALHPWRPQELAASSAASNRRRQPASQQATRKG